MINICFIFQILIRQGRLKEMLFRGGLVPKGEKDLTLLPESFYLGPFSSKRIALTFPLLREKTPIDVLPRTS